MASSTTSKRAPAKQKVRAWRGRRPRLLAWQPAPNTASSHPHASQRIDDVFAPKRQRTGAPEEPAQPAQQPAQQPAYVYREEAHGHACVPEQLYATAMPQYDKYAAGSPLLGAGEEPGAPAGRGAPGVTAGKGKKKAGKAAARCGVWVRAHGADGSGL